MEPKKIKNGNKETKNEKLRCSEEMEQS